MRSIINVSRQYSIFFTQFFPCASFAVFVSSAVKINHRKNEPQRTPEDTKVHKEQHTMKKFKQLNRQRRNRAYRVSNAVKRYSDRPRLCVFRSNSHIYAQVIDDEQGKTLVSAGTLDKDLKKAVKNGGNCAAAEKVGAAIATKALAAGVTKVAFDRHGFKYHGRVKALADAARGAGLDIGAAGEVKERDEKAPKKQKVSKEDKIAAKVAAGKAGAATRKK